MVLCEKYGKTEDDLIHFLKEYNSDNGSLSGMVLFSTAEDRVLEGIKALFDENDFVEMKFLATVSEVNHFYQFCDTTFSYDFSSQLCLDIKQGKKVVYLRSYHIEMDTYIKIMRYIFDKPLTIYYYDKDVF